MSDLVEETLTSEEIYHGKIICLERDTVRLPNGREAVREVIRHPGAVAVVPVDAEGWVYMVRQYRYPFSRVMLEIPAGKLDKGESVEAAARRELSEETGLEAQTLRPMGEFDSSVAFLDEAIHLYLATGLTRRQAHPDEDEFLRVVRLPLDTLVERVCRGEIRDGKTQAALLKAHLLLQG